jgi:PilZ domain
MHNRRFEIRIPRADPVEIHWDDQLGKRRKDPAYLEDISTSGAAIRAQTPVPVGTRIAFYYQSRTLVGMVKHRARGESSYLHGIEFEPGYEWSSQPQ